MAQCCGAVFALRGTALITAPRGDVNVGKHDDTAFELYDTAPQTDVTVDRIISLCKLTLDPTFGDPAGRA